MLSEFVVQVLAGVTVLTAGGLFVMFRRRAKGFTRASPIVLLSVVASLVATALVAAYLVGSLVAAPEGSFLISNSLMPIVSRIEGSDVVRRRGFFTPQGYLVAPAHGFPVGKAVTVTWTVDGINASTAASIAQLGGCGQIVALLEVGEGPRPTLPIGDSSDLQPGDTVTRFIPNEQVSGTVVEVGAKREVGSGCTWLVTSQLNNSRNVYSGDAGAPVLDASGRVVAMIAMNDIEQRQTLSIPIEHIREEFPWAFEAQARPTHT